MASMTPRQWFELGYAEASRMIDDVWADVEADLDLAVQEDPAIRLAPTTWKIQRFRKLLHEECRRRDRERMSPAP